MSAELEIAITAVKEAGGMMLEANKRYRQLEYKDSEYHYHNSRKNFVTQMDLECEKRIISLLYNAFPDYGFLTEESAAQNLGADRIWVIDPLDGTISYGHGLNSYATAVALLHKKEPVIAVIYHPEQDELYCAEKGAGAYLGKQRLKVSNQTAIEKSLITMGHRIFRIDDYPKATKDLVKRMKRLRVSESCSQELCYLAAGRIDGFIRTLQPTYDYVMGKIMVEEAGGVLRTFSNEEIRIQLNCERNTNIIAGNESLVTQLLSFVHI